jgi:hypothetical protein
LASTSKIQKKSLKTPDKALTFEKEKEKIEIVNLGKVTIARVTRAGMELGQTCQTQSKNKKL